MNKSRVNITLYPDTLERLKQYAFENHMTVSAVIENWTWSAKVIKNSQNMAEIPFEELLNNSNGGI